MIAFIWPIALVVLSNTVYQICAKSVPEGMNPLASLVVTYLVAAAASLAMYHLLGGRDLVGEFRRLNWAPIALGVVIVGLEVGFIYAYKAGWQVSVASVVQSAFLAIALLLVGRGLYREALTWNKLLGVGVCLAGLALINLK